MCLIQILVQTLLVPIRPMKSHEMLIRPHDILDVLGPDLDSRLEHPSAVKNNLLSSQIVLLMFPKSRSGVARLCDLEHKVARMTLAIRESRMHSECMNIVFLSPQNPLHHVIHIGIVGLNILSHQCRAS